MSNPGLPQDGVRDRVVRRTGKWSAGRLSVRVGVFVAASVLAVPLFLLLFGGAILNRYGKEKAERAFAAAHPSYVLRIGQLDYEVGANRLVAHTVILHATNAALKVGCISLTGVHWTSAFWGTAVLADLLAHASLDATNLDAEFPEAHYRIRCARLRGSVSRSELVAEGTDLGPVTGDEGFFEASAFRTPRFRLLLPECRVLGLAYDELLRGQGYRARSVHFTDPSLDTLVNRDKPLAPFASSPLMVQEALAAIGRPLRVGSLSISNGHLAYSERLVVGAVPGVLTIGAIGLSVEGIANRGETGAAIQLQGQGELMNAGTMQMRMSIPVTSSNLSLHYSGSLSAMDLTRLDAFLEIAEHTRIKSGTVQEAAFEIDVNAGHARGRVHAIYRDLEIALLDKQTGSEHGLGNRVRSFLAGVFKFRKANAAEGLGSRKEGEVDYLRKPEEQFQQFAWFALRTGVLDLISH